MSGTLQRSKLLITIVNHGLARKVVKASKDAGAEGGTTIIGKGTASRALTSLLGLPAEREKEIILTLANEDKIDAILQSVAFTAQLAKPGHGIAFVIDVRKVAGICHLSPPACRSDERRGGTEMTNSSEILCDLLVTIVNKGHAETVIRAATGAGAEGGTILYGRGTGIHEHAKLFGITIEPEKEIVLNLIDRRLSNKVLEAVITETELDKPGKGIAFMLPVDKVAGIGHLLERQERPSDHTQQ